jgi:hypothetical protein
MFLYVIMSVSHRKHLWASTACYGDNFTLLYVDVRTSQETPVNLHGLLRGKIYFIISRCSYLTGNTPIGLYGLLRREPYFSVCR